ncbi:MAG: hypothetical protein GYB31_09060 [Bacteroidetes bacterium]|nr:hypothetical protein [Bacteroidota bacterium]
MRYLPIILILFSGFSLRAQNLENIGSNAPVKLRSGFNLSFRYYESNRDTPLQPGLSWYLSGSPVLEIYGVSLPFHFLLSNQQRSIQQPFNEFGVSPYYKWVRLHMGYFNPRHSQFTLNGKRMLGGGIELTPGKLRFAFAAGRFRKPIAFQNNPATPETFLLPGAEPSFKQTGFAVKLGVGSERNYFDLHFLKGRDVPEENVLSDTLGINPAENAIIGTGWKIQPTDWLAWSGEIAISGFTRDQTAALIPDSTLPAQNFISSILEPRETSQVFAAAESELKLGVRPFSLSFRYRRIDPDYKSMGAYFFQTDLQSFTVAPTYINKDGSLSLSGSLGWQTDNLYDQKVADSRRIIGSGVLNYQHNATYGITAQYSNYGLSQTPINLNYPDTITIAQVSHQALVNPWYRFGQSYLHSISASGTWFVLTGLQGSLNTLTNQGISLNYNLQAPQGIWSQQFGISWRKTSNSLGLINTTGLRWRGQIPMLEKKLTLSCLIAWFRNTDISSGLTGSLLNIQPALIWKVFKSQQLQLQYAFRRNVAPETTLGTDFLEHRAFISYGIQF